jgi:hypothetical protein
MSESEQLGAPVLPWAALNVGYERGSGKFGDFKSTASGYEFGLTVGADYKVEKLAVGPYVGFAMAQYTSIKYEQGGASASPEFDKKFHNFLSFGLRGAYSL